MSKRGGGGKKVCRKLKKFDQSDTVPVNGYAIGLHCLANEESYAKARIQSFPRTTGKSVVRVDRDNRRDNYVCAHVCVHVCARSVPVNTSLVNVQVRKCVHEVYCLVIIRNVAYATVRKAIKKWWTSELNRSRVYYFFLMQILSGFFLLFSSLIFF